MKSLRDSAAPAEEAADARPAEAERAATHRDAVWAAARRVLSVDSLWFGLAAILIGLHAQLILTRGSRPAYNADIAAASRWYLIAVAVLLFGWSASYRNRTLLQLPATATGSLRRRLRDWTVPRPLAVVVSAILLNALAIGLLRNDWSCWPGGILWVASMALLVAAFLGERPSASVAADGEDASDSFPWKLPRWVEVAFVAAILTIATAFRLWRLGDLAPGMHGDEGEAGTQALSILGGNPVSPFARGWFNQPNIYYWSLAIVMKVFGTGLFGLRMFACICGVVTVLFTYLVAREMFGQRAAIIAGSFMSFQSVDLLFSRQEFSNVTVPPLLAMMFYFLVRGLRTRRHLDFVAGGLAAGFATYYFAGGRLIGPVGGLFLLYLALTRRRFLRCYWTHCLVFCAGFVLMVTPFVAYFIAYPVLGMQYPNDRFIWLHHADLAALYGSSSWSVILFGQLTRTLSVITYGIDASAMSALNFPIARPLEAVLIVLGLAWAAFRFRDTRFAALNIWFWSSIIAGGVLTTEAPNLPRILGILPVLAIAIAAVLDHLADQVMAAAVRLGSSLSWRRAGQLVGGTLGCAAILVSGIQNKQIYVDYYLNTHPDTIVTGQAMYVQQYGLRYRYYGMGAPAIYWTHGDNRFINPHADGTDAVNPAAILPLTDNGSNGRKPANFLLWPDMYTYLTALRAYYPGGRKIVYPLGDPDNASEPIVGYLLTSRQIDARRVARVTIAPARGRPVTVASTTLGTAGLAMPAGLHYPARVTWNGGLVAPAYGTFLFRATSPRGAQLSIDRVPVRVKSPGTVAAIRLAIGVHSVTFSITVQSSHANVSLDWAIPGSRLRSVERRYLWDGAIGRSWLARIQPVVAGATAADAFYRVDGFLGYRDAGLALGFF